MCSVVRHLSKNLLQASSKLSNLIILYFSVVMALSPTAPFPLSIFAYDWLLLLDFSSSLLEIPPLVDVPLFVFTMMLPPSFPPNWLFLYPSSIAWSICRLIKVSRDPQLSLDLYLSSLELFSRKPLGNN